MRALRNSKQRLMGPSCPLFAYKCFVTKLKEQTHIIQVIYSGKNPVIKILKKF